MIKEKIWKKYSKEEILINDKIKITNVKVLKLIIL
jgi:hypothetical protein